jgi:hypothetical protein
LAVQKFQCDDELTMLDILNIRRLGVSFQQGLIGVEGVFVLMAGLVTAADQVLGFGRVVRKRPDLDDAFSGLERKLEFPLIESLLGEIQLVFGPQLAPIALGTGHFVAPSFAGPVDQWRGRSKRQRHQEQQEQAKSH